MGSVPKTANEKTLTIEELAERVAKLAANFEKVQANAEEAQKRHLPSITIGLASWKRAKDDLKRFAREIEDGIEKAEDGDIGEETEPPAKPKAKRHKTPSGGAGS